MQQFIDYLDHALPDDYGNKILYKFKRKLLDEMNARYLEVSRRGITNQKVITDLIISEHADIKAEYRKYSSEIMAKKRAKNRVIIRIIGSAVYLVGLLIVFLLVSIPTEAWGRTWVIPVDGLLLWICYLLTLGVAKITSFKKIFHIFARILLGFDVMLFFVAAFLLVFGAFRISIGWVLIIMGVAAVLIADSAYIHFTKVRFAIINYLIYIPIIATMFYIILSAMHILSWGTGWLLIIMSLFVDVIFMYASALRNRRYKQEVIDTWQEN
ncbi:MAG: hypothetical protein J1E05_03460 [Eubacterium sp.]|nr:hypothetical protein [Eubacterium sp.]